MIKEEISYFRDYLNLVVSTTKNSLSELERREQGLRDNGTEPIIDEFGSTWDPYEDLANDYYRYKEIEQLMLRTLVIGIFIHIEHQIAFICERVERSQDLSFSHKDLKGSGVTRAVSYLEKSLSIEFPFNESDRNDFKIARIIRNSLVHLNAIIDKPHFQLVNKFIEQNTDLLTINEYRKITISPKYIEKLIVLTEHISTDLGELIQKN